MSLPEFQEALQEVEPEVNLVKIVQKRPIPVIIAFCMFSILMLIHSIRIDTEQFIDLAQQVALVSPKSINLIKADDYLYFDSTVSLNLDFTKALPSLSNALALALANKFEFIVGKLEGPSSIYFGSNGTWNYLANVYSDSTVKVDLNTENQDISVNTKLGDVGRTETIKLFLNEAEKGNLQVKVNGGIVISRFGINVRTNYEIYQNITLNSQLPEIYNLIITDNKNSVQFDAFANMTIDSKVTARLPPLHWLVKIPGCSNIITVCNGISGPLKLESSLADMHFTTTLNTLPPIFDQCENGMSPLESWINNYYQHGKATLFIEGVATENQPKILNELLMGYDVPYVVENVEQLERLLRNVTLTEVSFNQIPTQRDQILFNGRVLANLVLPKFIDISDAKAAIAVKSIRGIIFLYKQTRDGLRDFGLITMSDWLETSTLANDEGYKVNVDMANVPMYVSNHEVFTQVSNEILVNGHSEVVYHAQIDAQLDTRVGSFRTERLNMEGVTVMHQNIGSF